MEIDTFRMFLGYLSRLCSSDIVVLVYAVVYFIS